MRLKAIGRHLLVRMEQEAIEDTSSGGIILARETVEKERGGIQIARVLDVGEFAFDDQPGISVRPGDRIITQRYPGSTLDLKQEWNDAQASKYRVILDTEVRCLGSEDGVEIDE